jgi:hypothetical protein
MDALPLALDYVESHLGAIAAALLMFVSIITIGISFRLAKKISALLEATEVLKRYETTRLTREHEQIRLLRELSLRIGRPRQADSSQEDEKRVLRNRRVLQPKENELASELEKMIREQSINAARLGPQ